MIPATGSIFFRDDYGTLYWTEWETLNVDGTNIVDYTTITKMPYVWGDMRTYDIRFCVDSSCATVRVQAQNAEAAEQMIYARYYCFVVAIMSVTEVDMGIDYGKIDMDTKNVYRRGICTVERQIIEPSELGYIGYIIAENSSQSKCYFQTSFNCGIAPTDEFKYHMDNAVSGNESAPVAIGPRFTNPGDPDYAPVFQWVLPDGSLRPVCDKESFWFVDVWGPDTLILLSPAPCLSPSLSPSMSPSLSPSRSLSPSLSISMSLSPSLSRSLSPSLSRSASPSLSPSLSPSTSLSPSPSLLSPSLSPSPSHSLSLSPIISLSPSLLSPSHS